MFVTSKSVTVKRNCSVLFSVAFTWLVLSVYSIACTKTLLQTLFCNKLFPRVCSLGQYLTTDFGPKARWRYQRWRTTRSPNRRFFSFLSFFLYQIRISAAVASLRTSPPPFFLVFIFFQRHNKKQRGRPTLQSLRDSPFSPKPVGTFISRAVRLRVSFSLCSDCLAGTPSMVSGVYAISFFVLAHWLRQILY